MTDEKKPADPRPVTEDKNPSVHRITRRRFTKAGAVAPVIMTLASRPVWGTACTQSALGSMTHTSHHPEEDPANCVLGCDTTYWTTNPGAWSALTGHQASDEFLSTFGITEFSDNICPAINKKAFKDGLKDASLLTVLSNGLSPNSARQRAVANAARAAVLGLLNSRAVEGLKRGAAPDISSGWNPYPSPQNVIADFLGAYRAFCGSDGKATAQAALNAWAADMDNRLAGAVCPFARYT